MKKILVASTNKVVVETVYNAGKNFSECFDSVFFTDTDDAISFIDYELPEIKVLDYTSKEIDCNRILAGINTDPWLHNGGIIAVVPNAAMVQEIEEKKDPNILIVQTLYSFKENFERVLKILWNHQHFLFNRGLQDRIGGLEKGSFVCGNDPLDIRLYVSFLVNYLYCSNRISDDGRLALQTTLMELLTNAVEHGNCGITYEEKSAWLESGKNILDLIHQKGNLPENVNKKIKINYIVEKLVSTFTIADEGDGFDWRARMAIANDPVAAYSEETHGRGMALSTSLVSSLTYNEKGNEVSFEIKNLKNVSNTIPGIMKPFNTLHVKKHEIICKQNEPSNDLYFIISGRYGVYSNNKLISVLTPNDMFIGEMAFLLNDRRSATIMSGGEGQLIKIPKTSFLNLIRKNPHYGIFLSKLLAQRVLRQNQRTLELAAELKELKMCEPHG